MAINVSLALRSKRLGPVAKLVWLWVSPGLSDEVAQVVKVGTTAQALGMKREVVRRAIRRLVRMRYLHCTTAPTTGTPGEYILGPRATRNPVWVAPTGPARGPVPPLEELPLFRLAS